MVTQAPPPTLEASDILRALGGPTALSRVISARRSAIANWSVEGIPPKYWLALARIAAASPDAKHITLETLEHHVARRRSAAVARAG